MATFLLEEEILGKDHGVVLSYGLWNRRYGGDPALVGRTIRIDGQDFTVVGVMPRQFQWQFWNRSELWVPLGYTKTDYHRDENSFVARSQAGHDGSSVTGGDANHRESLGTGVPQRGRGDGQMGRAPG